MRRSPIALVFIRLIPEIHFVVKRTGRVIVVLIIENRRSIIGSVCACNLITHRIRQQIAQIIGTILIVVRPYAGSTCIEIRRDVSNPRVPIAVARGGCVIHSITYRGRCLILVNVRASVRTHVKVGPGARTLCVIRRERTRFGGVVAVALPMLHNDVIAADELVFLEFHHIRILPGHFGRRFFAGNLEGNKRVALGVQMRPQIGRRNNDGAPGRFACFGGFDGMQFDRLGMVQNAAAAAADHLESSGQKAVIAIIGMNTAYGQIIAQLHLIGERNIARPVIARTGIDVTIVIFSWIIAPSTITPKRNMRALEPYVEIVVVSKCSVLVAIIALNDRIFDTFSHEIAVENHIDTRISSIMPDHVRIPVPVSIGIHTVLVMIRPRRPLVMRCPLVTRYRFAGMTPAALFAADFQIDRNLLVCGRRAAPIVFVETAGHFELRKSGRIEVRISLDAEIGTRCCGMRIVGILVAIDVNCVAHLLHHGRLISTRRGIIFRIEIIFRIVIEGIAEVGILVVGHIGHECTRIGAVGGFQQIETIVRLSVFVMFERIAAHRPQRLVGMPHRAVSIGHLDIFNIRHHFRTDLHVVGVEVIGRQHLGNNRFGRRVVRF